MIFVSTKNKPYYMINYSNQTKKAEIENVKFEYGAHTQCVQDKEALYGYL